MGPQLHGWRPGRARGSRAPSDRAPSPRTLARWRRWLLAGESPRVGQAFEVAGERGGVERRRRRLSRLAAESLELAADRGRRRRASCGPGRARPTGACQMAVDRPRPSPARFKRARAPSQDFPRAWDSLRAWRSGPRAARASVEIGEFCVRRDRSHRRRRGPGRRWSKSAPDGSTARARTSVCVIAKSSPSRSWVKTSTTVNCSEVRLSTVTSVANRRTNLRRRSACATCAAATNCSISTSPLITRSRSALDPPPALLFQRDSAAPVRDAEDVEHDAVVAGGDPRGKDVEIVGGEHSRDLREQAGLIARHDDEFAELALGEMAMTADQGRARRARASGRNAARCHPRA